MSQVSDLMQSLRDRLNNLDISWDDYSDSYDGLIAERTRINPLYDGGALTSVLYMYDTAHGFRAMSYGYPEMLECWNVRWSEEPEPMSVDDIIWNLINEQPSQEG